MPADPINQTIFWVGVVGGRGVQIKPILGNVSDNYDDALGLFFCAFVLGRKESTVYCLRTKVMMHYASRSERWLLTKVHVSCFFVVSTYEMVVTFEAAFIFFLSYQVAVDDTRILMFVAR